MFPEYDVQNPQVHMIACYLVSFAERKKNPNPTIMKLWDMEEEWAIEKSAEVETGSNSTTWTRGFGDILPISGYIYINPTCRPHYQTTKCFRTSLPKVFGTHCD